MLPEAATAFFNAVPSWYLDGTDDDPLRVCIDRLAEDYGLVLAGVAITQLRAAINRWEAL